MTAVRPGEAIRLATASGRRLSVALNPIEDDNADDVRGLFTSCWTLCVHVILDQRFEFEWRPGAESNCRHADLQHVWIGYAASSTVTYQPCTCGECRWQATPGHSK